MPHYDDIINLPHHVSTKRPQMSMLDRAAQFAPFAALTGYDAAIKETGRLTDDRIELDEESLNVLNMKFQTQLKSRNQESDDKDAELASEKRSRDFIESEKAKREANESGIWKNGRFMRSSNRNGGKLSKLKISY